MITLKDLSEAKKFVKKMNALDYDYYSRKQSDVAYDLCTQSKTERSDNVEILVMTLFDRAGYDLDRRGGTNQRYDLWANDERIEVKSSLAEKHVNRKGEVYYTYSFMGVKPELFDRLVLVYITPYGVDFRILTKRAVYGRICNGELKRGRGGYSILHNKNSKIIGKDLSSFLGLTADKISVESYQRRKLCPTGA
jgi:hypothetical protein